MTPDHTKVNSDIPVDFDPEIAFGAVTNIIAALCVSYGLERLDVGYARGYFIATIWKNEGKSCWVGHASNGNDALKDAIATMKKEETT